MAANNSKYLIDSSFLLAYLLPDEQITEVQEFFNQLKIKELTLLAPPLLPYEVLNGFNMAVRRKRMKMNMAKKLGEKFLKMPIGFISIDLMKTLKLANKYKLTFYDASYLYLARNEKLPLLTIDSNLQKLA